MGGRGTGLRRGCSGLPPRGSAGKGELRGGQEGCGPWGLPLARAGGPGWVPPPGRERAAPRPGCGHGAGPGPAAPGVTGSRARPGRQPWPGCTARPGLELSPSVRLRDQQLREMGATPRGKGLLCNWAGAGLGAGDWPRDAGGCAIRAGEESSGVGRAPWQPDGASIHSAPPVCPARPWLGCAWPGGLSPLPGRIGLRTPGGRLALQPCLAAG